MVRIVTDYNLTTPAASYPPGRQSRSFSHATLPPFPLSTFPNQRPCIAHPKDSCPLASFYPSFCSPVTKAAPPSTPRYPYRRIAQPSPPPLTNLPLTYSIASLNRNPPIPISSSRLSASTWP